MLRARHLALGLVQSTQWATVGHVVAAVAAQAQASDDSAQISPFLFSRASQHFCAADFLFIFIGSCVIFSPWFSVLVFHVPHFLSYLFRCALL